MNKQQKKARLKKLNKIRKQATKPKPQDERFFSISKNYGPSPLYRQYAQFVASDKGFSDEVKKAAQSMANGLIQMSVNVEKAGRIIKAGTIIGDGNGRPVGVVMQDYINGVERPVVRPMVDGIIYGEKITTGNSADWSDQTKATPIEDILQVMKAVRKPTDEAQYIARSTVLDYETATEIVIRYSQYPSWDVESAIRIISSRSYGLGGINYNNLFGLLDFRFLPDERENKSQNRRSEQNCALRPQLVEDAERPIDFDFEE